MVILVLLNMFLLFTGGCQCCFNLTVRICPIHVQEIWANAHETRESL